MTGSLLLATLTELSRELQGRTFWDFTCPHRGDREPGPQPAKWSPYFQIPFDALTVRVTGYVTFVSCIMVALISQSVH